MELTNELKDKIEKAATLEEKKDVLKQAGIELADDQLEIVSGGGSTSIVVKCPNCGADVIVPPFEVYAIPSCEKCHYAFFVDDHFFKPTPIK